MKKPHFITFIFLLLFKNEAISRENTGTEIEEIIVRSTSIAHPNTPFSYSNLSSKELNNFPSRLEPSFLLSQSASVNAYSDSGSYQGYSYFRIRGIDQTRINMSLDGIPLNEPEDQGVYFSNYPGVFGALKSVQIQRGVGLSQNGTASFGGNIQLFSKDLDSDKYGTLEADIGSFNSKSTGAEFMSGNQGNKALFIRASGLDSDGYKYHSGNRSYSLFSKAQRKDKEGDWKILAFTGRQDNELAWLGLSEAELAVDRKSNGNVEREKDRFSQSLFALERQQNINHTTTLNTKAYYNYLQGNYDFDLNNFLGIPEAGELYNYALQSKFFGVLSSLNINKNRYRVSAGIHVNQYARIHTGTEKTQNAYLYENTGKKPSVSIFLKSELHVKEDLFLFSDFQYRETAFKYNGDVDLKKLSWRFFNPRIGISYVASEKGRIYYSIGKTGREPTRTDILGGNDNLLSDSDGNPLIFARNAESVINHEAGYRYSNTRLQGAANFFYMRFDNELTLKGGFGPNGLLINEDVDKSYRRGIEGELRFALSDTTQLGVNSTYNESKIQDQGQSFSPVLSPKWVFNTSLDHSRDAFGIGLEAKYQSSAYLNLENSYAIGGFSLVNLYLNYQINQTNLQLRINNALNKEFNASGAIDIYGMPSYFVGVPRNVLLSLKWTIY